MFTAFEWYYLASLGYPVLSAGRAFYLRPKYEQDIVHEDVKEVLGTEFFTSSSSYSPPIYAGSEHVKIPIGGGTSQSWDSVGSSFKSSLTDVVTVGTGVKITPQSEATFRTGTAYYNHYDDLLPLLESMNLKHAIPVSLPMRVDHYKIPGPRIYYDKAQRMLSNDQQLLVKHRMWARRLPGTLTIPCVALALFGLAWANHVDGGKRWSYRDPPTDILGKIMGYTARQRWEDSQLSRL